MRWVKFDGASYGQSDPLQAHKVPYRMADAERGQRIDIGISASIISEVDFPQGKWKGECEGDFLKGLTNIPVARQRCGGLRLQGLQGSNC